MTGQRVRVKSHGFFDQFLEAQALRRLGTLGPRAPCDDLQPASVAA
jgi:hypothetical protein